MRYNNFTPSITSHTSKLLLHIYVCAIHFNFCLFRCYFHLLVYFIHAYKLSASIFVINYEHFFFQPATDPSPSTNLYATK